MTDLTRLRVSSIASQDIVYPAGAKTLAYAEIMYLGQLAIVFDHAIAQDEQAIVKRARKAAQRHLPNAKEIVWVTTNKAYFFENRSDYLFDSDGGQS